MRHLYFVDRWRCPRPSLDPDPGLGVLEADLVNTVTGRGDDHRIDRSSHGDHILELSDCMDVRTLPSPYAPQLLVEDWKRIP